MRRTSRKKGCRRLDTWSPSSGLWTVGPMQPFEVSASATIFGHFRCLPTTFHGEATYFGTSSPSFTILCPPWPTNLCRSKASYYSHHDFYCLFPVNWKSFVRWNPQKFNVLFISFHLIYIYIYWLCFEGILENIFYEIELSIWTLSRFVWRANRGSK